MMTRHAKIAGAAAALLGLAAPQAALAQDCVAQQDVSDAVVYAFPSMVEALDGKCGATLSPTGFLATGSDEMVAAFVERQDAAWPGALRLLSSFSNRGGGPVGDDNEGFAEIISALPEGAIRPFVDALIVQELGKAIAVKDCGNIERGLELVASLPPENIGGLAAFLFDMADVKDPAICPYEPE